MFKIQANCDSEYKFRWMACTSPGATHDSTSFSSSSLGRALMDRGSALSRALYQEWHCIVADEAYAASEVVAVPWSAGGTVDR